MVLGMTPITVTRTIDASIDVVFSTVSDIRQLSKALPHVIRFEFLSVVNSGVGARFRETRLMKGKEVTSELEITEYVENDRVRMVADSHGTVWHTLFTVTSEGGSTTLTTRMDSRSDKLCSRVMNPLIRGMIAKAVERDMDLVKAFCESGQSE